MNDIRNIVNNLISEENLDEGIAGAIVGEFGTSLKNGGRDFVSWFRKTETKMQKLSDRCDELVEWLEAKKKAHPNLSLEMDGFRTWMKTSETFKWRYYMIINDGVFNEIMRDVKDEKKTHLDNMLDINFRDRKKAAEVLERARKVEDLIRIVRTYQSRSKAFYKALVSRKASIWSAPLQFMIAGFSDLESSVRKIVNLAT